MRALALGLLLVPALARADYNPDGFDGSSYSSSSNRPFYVMLGGVAAGAALGYVALRDRNHPSGANGATCLVAGAVVGFLGGFAVNLLVEPPPMMTVDGGGRGPEVAAAVGF